ncbi:MAG: hypothetical protein QE271_06955 [Bacteriovoracaceae bacterium]|nr:hypothetical protein [Bacteriovoracaceae bacterium]
MKMLNLFAFLFLTFAAVGANAQSDDKILSFGSTASLNEIAAGKVTKTIRLKDRVVAPYSFAAGKVLVLVNSNKTEDARTVADQLAAAPYGKASLTKVVVTEFAKLNAADQAEVKKYYTDAQVAEANNVVTSVEFKFVK